MIRINRITPLGYSQSPIPIRNIRNEFYNQLHQKGKHKIINLLRNLYDRGINLTLAEKELIKYLIDHYKVLLIGDVNILNKLKTEIESNGWQILVYNNKQTKFGVLLLKIFGYKKRFRSIKDRGIWLSKQLNIKSCPYCNSQYTLHVIPENSDGIAKFQFDHYFPKDKYPYFSVSLYNLIPSCANCNHRKKNSDPNIQENYHPYYHSLACVSKFHLDYPDELDKLSFNQILKMDYDRELEIKFIHKYSDAEDFVTRHNKDFDIDPIYERHKDHAHELLVKATINNRYYQNAVMQIEGLFQDRSVFLKYLLGNYLDEKDILKRPLAKFYQDIANQLKLID